MINLNRVGHRSLMTSLTRQAILLTGNTRKFVQVPPLMRSRITNIIEHRAFSLGRRGLDGVSSF